MSFIRFGMDGSDIYCFEHVDGTFTTIVADNFEKPGTPKCRHEPLSDGWMQWHEVWFGPSGHAHDGAIFKDKSLADMLATALRLQTEGYCVPDRLFERVNAEMAETAKCQ